MTIRLSDIVGGGGLARLAPDLNYPNNKDSFQTYSTITVPLTPASYTTVLSLTGKYAISSLSFNGTLNEVYGVRLTVDGVIIWDSNSTFGSGDEFFIGKTSVSNDVVFTCSSSLLLELNPATDTSINVRYGARPIL